MSRRRRSRGLRGLGQEPGGAVNVVVREEPHSLLAGVPIGVGACYLVAKYTDPLTDEQIAAIHRPGKAVLAGLGLGVLMLASRKWRKAGVGTLLGTAAYLGYRAYEAGQQQPAAYQPPAGYV